MLGVYVIALSENPQDQLDIIPSYVLIQKQALLIFLEIRLFEQVPWVEVRQLIHQVPSDQPI